MAKFNVCIGPNSQYVTRVLQSLRLALFVYLQHYFTYITNTIQMFVYYLHRPNGISLSNSSSYSIAI